MEKMRNENKAGKRLPIACIFLVAGIMAVIFGVFLIIISGSKYQRYVPTDAEIVSVNSSGDLVQCLYEVRGEIYQCSGKVNTAYQSGDRITVYYNDDEPDDAVLVRFNRSFVVIIFAGAVLLFAAAVMFFASGAGTKRSSLSLIEDNAEQLMNGLEDLFEERYIDPDESVDDDDDPTEIV